MLCDLRFLRQPEFVLVVFRCPPLRDPEEILRQVSFDNNLLPVLSLCT